MRPEKRGYWGEGATKGCHGGRSSIVLKNVLGAVMGNHLPSTLSLLASFHLMHSYHTCKIQPTKFLKRFFLDPPPPPTDISQQDYVKRGYS